MSKIRVLHVAAEVFPLVKTGGLADVIAALPPALARHGVDARLLLPGLPAIRDALEGTTRIATIGPMLSAARVTLLRGRLPGSDVPAYVIDAPWLYDRPGNPYLAPDRTEWPDNPQRFALLGWMAAHLASGEFTTGRTSWRPDVLHAHDWHAGLAGAYLAGHPICPVARVFTIHNLAYQGLYPLDRFKDLKLPAGFATPHGLEFHGQGSFMKAGLVWSDHITTVSPRYAREIQTGEFGEGLQGVLAERRDRVHGLLNGIDDAVWNPATDAAIDRPFDVDDLSGKAACKAAVQRTLGLAVDASAPLAVVVSRLAWQKGIDLAIDALPAWIAGGGQFALLGEGDAALERRLRELASARPDRVTIAAELNEPLAHRLIAAGDVVLMPSRFEPCGLTQLYGMRYGTVPIVRRVGGLADTVIDLEADPAHATGFAFDAASAEALAATLQRALAAFRTPSTWAALVHRGMRADFSWTRAAAGYAALYRKIMAERA